jgi:uncharacterized protein YhbP (UPF0306 family)
MIDKRIVKFLHKHHVLTIATSVNNEPWCANCFYVYLEKKNILIFTTDTDTRHGKEFKANPVVSGSVVLETPVIGKIRGIQFQGIVSEPEGEDLALAEMAYLKRFPVAMLMDTHLWMVELTYIKMTDNRLGFGKKIVWNKKNLHRGKAQSSTEACREKLCGPL